uniref:T9SS type B sorting domain-containing protein n=1 Tax=Mesonia aquimarina TaxID=1504967 RepID=UPI000EF6049D
SISVSNAGPQAATGVLVEDLLPSGYSYLLSSATLGNYDQSTGIWTVGTVGSGVTESLQLTVTVNASGNYTNIAEVSASDVADPDSTPGNADASEDDYDSAVTTPIAPSADLELSKSVVGGNTSPAVGSQITFEIVIENNGPQDATGVIVNDLLPSGYTFVLANYTTGNYSNATGDWTIGIIASGTIETLQLTVTVNASGNYTNIAEVSASDVADPDSTPNNDDGDQSEDDEDSVLINVQFADLSLNKSVDNVNANVGDLVTFIIQLENDGIVTANGVAVQDIVPLGYSNILNISNGGVFDGENINWTSLTVPLSGLTITYQAIVNKPILIEDEYLNRAQITASDQYDPDSTPNNDDGDQSEDDEDSAFVNIPETDIAIVKEVDNEKPAMDALVNFTITASNIGNLDASSVEVFDLLPSGYQLNSVTASSGNYNSSSGIWFIPNIASGSSEIMTITAKVIDVNDYINIASLLSLDQLDNNDANNEDRVAVEPTCLKIYNQFSPNDDGSNETFYIDCITNYPNNVLEVYNRWGDLVFKQIRYDNTWKGTSNGPEKTLPVGTYFYVLDLGDGSEKVSGWLYLKR